jgi:disulfide bond formation protein DsbB
MPLPCSDRGDTVQPKGTRMSDTRAATLSSGWAETARSRPIVAAAAIVAVGGAAAILGAWFFQYGVGLKPCPLCLEQRYPYYFAIPLAALVMMGDQVGSSRKVLVAALGAIALGMLWNAGLGTYHAGVEWKLWAGPRDCSGALESLGNAGSLLDTLDKISVVRCDEAAWRFLGVSLAGYNAVISLGLAAVAAWGAFAGWRQAPAS